jgi:uncharacterized protein (DUF58 family)
VTGPVATVAGLSAAAARLRRAALRPLTARGRALPVGGLGAAAAGAVLGDADLVRLGLLCAALPVVAVLAVRYRPGQHTVIRRVDPGELPLGEAGTVTVTLTAVGRATPTARCEDTLPAGVRDRARFVAPALPAGSRHAVSYALPAARRGVHAVGPLQVEVTDPFGLVRLRRTAGGTARLVVTPRVEPLPVARFLGGRPGEGQLATLSITGGDDDSTVREYRLGDDLRRVHWATTARTGDLMVRREEPTAAAAATVLLDNRAGAHTPPGGTDLSVTFERAVSVAASVGEHLARRGFRVVLAEVARAPYVIPAGGWARSGGRGLRQHLALSALAPRGDLAAMGGLGAAGGGLTVGVFGALSEDDLAVLAGGRARRGTAAALLLDLAAWPAGRISPPGSPGLPAGVAAAALHAAGWAVTVLRRDTDLAGAWAALGAGAPPTATPARRTG